MAVKLTNLARSKLALAITAIVLLCLGTMAWVDGGPGNSERVTG